MNRVFGVLRIAVVVRALVVLQVFCVRGVTKEILPQLLQLPGILVEVVELRSFLGVFKSLHMLDETCPSRYITVCVMSKNSGHVCGLSTRGAWQCKTTQERSIQASLTRVFVSDMFVVLWHLFVQPKKAAILQ